MNTHEGSPVLPTHYSSPWHKSSKKKKNSTGVLKNKVLQKALVQSGREDPSVQSDLLNQF